MGSAAGMPRVGTRTTLSTNTDRTMTKYADYAVRVLGLSILSLVLIPIVGKSNNYNIKDDDLGDYDVYENIIINDNGLYVRNVGYNYSDFNNIINNVEKTIENIENKRCESIPCAVQSCEYCRWEYVPGVGVIFLYRYCIE
jgi:hypothetical protein